MAAAAGGGGVEGQQLRQRQRQGPLLVCIQQYCLATDTPILAILVGLINNYDKDPVDATVRELEE
jgi:hypothetical protein